MKSTVLSFFLLCGFSTTAIANICNYSDIKGVEYRLQDEPAKDVKLFFYKYPDRYSYEQGSFEDYISLIKKPFKVTSTSAITKSSQSYIGFLSENRFKDVAVDGHAYKTDNLFNIELTTSDCQKFYFNLGVLNPRGFKRYFYRNDNKPITTKNYFDFVGEVIKPSSVQASSKYAEFEGKTSVSTDVFNNYFIRGYFDLNKKEYDFIEVQIKRPSSNISPNSIEESAGSFFHLAKDIDNNLHQVRHVKNDIQCFPGSSFGCSMSETIAVKVDEKFLRKYKDGFKLKLIGEFTIEPEVIGDVVKAFLDETDRLKREK